MESVLNLPVNTNKLLPLLTTPSNLPKLQTRTTFKQSNNYSSNNSTTNNTRVRPTNDFDDRRAKGLCFWCDEKYVVRHQCKKRQLYVLEANEGEETESEEIEMVEEEGDLGNVNPHISAQAMSEMSSTGCRGL